MSGVNKKSLSERDICTKFITPALSQAGWDVQTQIREEVSFTKGRVLVSGRIYKRGEAKRADYVLHYRPNTGIKTNLLFFTKGEPTKEIWYYEHPYPPGVKSYNKTKPIRIEEFEAERKWWGKPGQEKKRKENQYAWRVSLADIAARGYNLDVKNPNVVDATHRDPAELLAEYQAAQAAVAEVREKLKRELQAALER